MVKDASEHACDEFLETINMGLEDGGDETNTIEKMELHEMQKRVRIHECTKSRTPTDEDRNRMCKQLH